MDFEEILTLTMTFCWSGAVVNNSLMEITKKYTPDPQVGFSFWNQDILLKAGKILTQDFKTTPMIPICGQLARYLHLIP